MSDPLWPGAVPAGGNRQAVSGADDEDGASQSSHPAFFSFLVGHAAKQALENLGTRLLDSRWMVGRRQRGGGIEQGGGTDDLGYWREMVEDPCGVERSTPCDISKGSGHGLCQPPRRNRRGDCVADHDDAYPPRRRQRGVWIDENMKRIKLRNASEGGPRRLDSRSHFCLHDGPFASLRVLRAGRKPLPDVLGLHEIPCPPFGEGLPGVPERWASTASTRRWCSGSGSKTSLVKMLRTWDSTVLALRKSRAAMA